MKNRKHHNKPTFAPRSNDIQKADECLASSFDSIIRARILVLGGLESLNLPACAFDEAIKNIPDYQQARKDVHRLLEQVKKADPRLHLELEAAINNLNVQAAKVGWSMGLANR